VFNQSKNHEKKHRLLRESPEKKQSESLNTE